MLPFSCEVQLSYRVVIKIIACLWSFLIPLQAQAQDSSAFSTLLFYQAGAFQELDQKSIAELSASLLGLIEAAETVAADNSTKPPREETDDRLVLIYSAPVKIKLFSQDVIEITDIVYWYHKQRFYLAASNRNDASQHVFSKLPRRALEKLHCNSPIKFGDSTLLCLQTTNDVFLDDAAIESRLAAACRNSENGSPEYVKCVESVLHTLWEEGKILYTNYDLILKRAWQANSEWSRSNGQALAQEHKLFDKYLEQVSLEREVAKHFIEWTQLRFKVVADALQDKAPNGTETQTEERRLKATIRIRQVQLDDLLRTNPELPPSQYLDPPYTFEQPQEYSQFAAVGRALGAVEVVPPIEKKVDLNLPPVSPVTSSSSASFISQEHSRRAQLANLVADLDVMKKEVRELTDRLIVARASPDNLDSRNVIANLTSELQVLQVRMRVQIISIQGVQAGVKLPGNGTAH